MHREGLKIHEFYTREYYSLITKTTCNVYRVALGELIPARKRKISPPQYGADYNTLSGSIGFADLNKKTMLIPKENTPSPFIKSELVDALVIEIIGIEPKYQGGIYVKLLYERIEEIAKEWGLHVIVADTIRNLKIRKIINRFGYQLYDDGLQAVKRL